MDQVDKVSALLFIIKNFASVFALYVYKQQELIFERSFFYVINHTRTQHLLICVDIFN